MNNSHKDNLVATLQLLTSTISKCEKIHPKFEVGTSQHTLLTNRIKALYIAKSLVLNDGTILSYTKEELTKALPPIASIISKTEKAQSKYEPGTTQFKRFAPLINAMHISKSLLEEELQKRV